MQWALRPQMPQVESLGSLVAQVYLLRLAVQKRLQADSLPLEVLLVPLNLLTLEVAQLVALGLSTSLVGKVVVLVQALEVFQVGALRPQLLDYFGGGMVVVGGEQRVVWALVLLSVVGLCLWFQEVVQVAPGGLQNL